MTTLQSCLGTCVCRIWSKAKRQICKNMLLRALSMSQRSSGSEFVICVEGDMRRIDTVRCTKITAVPRTTRVLEPLRHSRHCRWSVLFQIFSVKMSMLKQLFSYLKRHYRDRLTLSEISALSRMLCISRRSKRSVSWVRYLDQYVSKRVTLHMEMLTVAKLPKLPSKFQMFFSYS